MKSCSLCGVNKRRNPRSSHCKECHNTREKARYQATPQSIDKSRTRRRHEVRDFLRTTKDVPCKDCGIKYHYVVMDFDHVRGKKLFNLSQAASVHTSLKMAMEEAEKCDIVCSNCHRMRTHVRRMEELDRKK